METIQAQIKASGIEKNRFGTFKGVFTPSILTILGVIMFMRAPFVVGQAGILKAILILCIAKAITSLTALSISAIATNMRVRGGGAYYLISRVLGPEFGGAIGIALFFALALSVPFYILGFAEALCKTVDVLQPYFLHITLTTAALFFAIAFVGAGWAIRIQFVIMGILFASILAFMGGALQLFEVETFLANLHAGYTERLIGDGEAGLFSFWLVFAIYFPAVTGIDAGLNMSGDLENPSRSIPRGTLAAIGVGFLVYLLQMLIAGGAFPREELVKMPFETIRDNALLGLAWLVALGVYAATLSSALGSYLGAPRVMQAVSRDPILDFLRPFAKGTKKGDEPRRALYVTAAITVAVLLWAGNDTQGGPLNVVASIITMFFLYSYGMINLAAFVERIGNNPSFRPTFRYFHWATALFGAIGCTVVSFLVNAWAAVAAVVIIAALYVYVRTRNLKSTFGDARRGLFYSTVRKNLLRLDASEEDPRNWRPTILAFSANPESRLALATWATWLESDRGILMLTQILVGEVEDLGERRAAAMRQLREACREHEIQAFPVVTVARSVGEGMRGILQAAGVGPLKPNVAVFGWTTREHAAAAGFAGHLRIAETLGMSLVVVRAEASVRPGRGKRIDLWWRGRENGGMMMILAWLLAANLEWEGSRIRVLRLIGNEAGRAPATEALEELIAPSRVSAEVRVIVSEQPFREVLHEHSADADCVFLGLGLPEEGREEGWQKAYGGLTAGLQASILVMAGGQADMMA